MEATIPLAYILLAIAAVAVVVFYIAWSRRSKPTQPGSERDPRRVAPDPDRDIRESP